MALFERFTHNNTGDDNNTDQQNQDQNQQQQQAAQSQEDINKLKAELEKYKHLDQLYQDLQSNPDLAMLLAQYYRNPSIVEQLNSMGQQQQQPQNNDAQEPELPMANLPQPPEEFIVDDIYNPNTPTGQWFMKTVALVGRQQAEAIAQNKIREVEQQLEELRAMNQQMLQMQQIEMLKQQLKQQFPGITDAEIDEAIRWGMQNQLTLADLLALRKIRESGYQGILVGQQQQTQQQLQQGQFQGQQNVFNQQIQQNQAPQQFPTYGINMPQNTLPNQIYQNVPQGNGNSSDNDLSNLIFNKKSKNDI